MDGHFGRMTLERLPSQGWLPSDSCGPIAPPKSHRFRSFHQTSMRRCHPSLREADRMAGGPLSHGYASPCPSSSSSSSSLVCLSSLSRTAVRKHRALRSTLTKGIHLDRRRAPVRASAARDDDPTTGGEGSSVANDRVPSLPSEEKGSDHGTQAMETSSSQTETPHEESLVSNNEGTFVESSIEKARQDGAAETSKEEDRYLWQRLIRVALRKVQKNLWPLLLVHFTCDTLVYLLHRISHRLTNEVAMRCLPSPQVTASAIGNLWWLSGNPAVANFDTGYQYLTIGFFLLAFPCNVLLKSIASAATILLCESDAGERMKTTVWWNPIRGLTRAWPIVKSTFGPISKTWISVFAVELLVSAAVIPLQFASLAVVTLPFTLPLILSLQAAAPAAVLEERKGWNALKRSRDLMRGIRWSLALPFVGLVIGQRLLEAGRGWLLGSIPPRFYNELIEIPVAIMLVGGLSSIFLSRMQDVLPWVAFTEAKRKAALETSNTTS